jgi:hypothetical protein
MMGGSQYPERELWFSPSYNSVGTNGAWVDTRLFAQNRGSALINVPGNLAGPVTITFNTADILATNDCAPDPATVVAMQAGGLCDPIVPLSITVAPTDPDYVVGVGKVVRLTLECRKAFVQAVASAATPGLSVMFIGAASRLNSI